MLLITLLYSFVDSHDLGNTQPKSKAGGKQIKRKRSTSSNKKQSVSAKSDSSGEEDVAVVLAKKTALGMISMDKDRDKAIGTGEKPSIHSTGEEIN